MKILIVKLGSIGDVVNTIPLFNILRESLTDSFIAWAIEPKAYPIIKNIDLLDKIIIFDRYHCLKSLPAFIFRLKKERFDIVLDLQRILKSGFFTFLSRAKRRIGFDKDRCKEFSWIWTNERIPASDPEKHMVEQYLEFARYLNITNSKVRWDVDISRGEEPKLKKFFFGFYEKPIAINIGASKPANRWFPESFASLIDILQNDYHIPVILTGGPEDEKFARIIKERTKSKFIDLVGKTSLNFLAGIFKGCRLFIGCDTGPMHIAVAMGSPVVSLFGASNPRRTGPYGYLDLVVRKEIDCSPCNKKKCPTRDCMRLIKPSDVLEKVDKVLNNKRNNHNINEFS